MTKLDILIRSSITLWICAGIGLPASAEITATTGAESTGTTFAPGTTPNTTDIQGGQKSSDNKNLFHSFGKFNVDAGQVANFKPDAGIVNILGTVTGGASLINGGIQVNGGSTTNTVNLFLMNPAGIVFGKGASLDINGAFTATTAKAIDFNGKWFNAFGTNTYSELIGNPIGLAFESGTPGSIFSAATISNAKPGQSITLVGGTVISTGDIKTAGGNISIATVEGGKYVKINVEGSILGVLLPTALPTSANTINSAPTSFNPPSLAELLTNTKVDLAATGVKNEGGVVTLVGNPAAVALIPDLDKAIADNNKALADFYMADADYKKAQATYDKALAAAGGNQALVDPTIVSAKETTLAASNNSNGKEGLSKQAINNIKQKIDTLSAVGEPSATFSGDTISKQNRLVFSGDVITRNLNTSLVGKNGGNVYIKSSQAILNGNINTSYQNPPLSPPDNPLKSGGNVFLDAQTELKTKSINTSARAGISKGYNGGNVTLFTKTKDIIVDEIYTIATNADDFLSGGGKLTKAESAGFIGGDVTVDAGGLFRVINGGISSSLFGVIKIDHGSTKPFASGFTFGPGFFLGSEKSIPKPDFIFPEGASGSKSPIATSSNSNGTVGTVYRDQSIDGLSITGKKTPITPPVTNEQDQNSNGGKPGTDVATNKSGDDSEKQNSTKDNSDNQASKPGDSEEDKEKAKKRKQKAKCKNNSSAIASAKLGTDPTRSGNSVDSAAEEFCPPNIDNGILQILTDRN